MKKFKVVGQSTIMDAEINVKGENEAHEIFENLRNTGHYSKVYILDNETNTVCRTYSISTQNDGVLVQEWYTLESKH